MMAQPTTRELPFNQLQPELMAAIEQHIQDRDMGDVLAQMLICCQTTAVARKMSWWDSLKARLGGYADPDPVHYTGIVVTPTWLIWGTHGDKRGTTILSARLDEIEVQDLAAIAARDKRRWDMIRDHPGISLYGTIGRFPQRSSVFIELGDDTAGEKLKTVLKEAIHKAHQT